VSDTFTFLEETPTFDPNFRGVAQWWKAPAATAQLPTTGNTANEIRFDTTALGLKYWNGSAWTLVGASASLGADLTALEALATTGLAARTGDGTWATRTLTGPAAGLTVTNGDGVSGNPTLALAHDLSALEALSGVGIAVRTAADTWAQRSITAPGSGLTVTNGNGVAGNPSLSLANNLEQIAVMASVGVAVRTGSGWVTRQIASSVADITVTNGTGVDGDVTIDLAGDLAALTGLLSTGLAVRTATSTWATRTIAAGTNVTVDNGSGVAGNPTINVPDASTSAKGAVQLATDGETTAGEAVQGSDGRLPRDTIAVFVAAATTYTNMPAATTDLFGNASRYHRMNWSGRTRCRLVGNVSAAGAAGAKAGVKVSADSGSTYFFVDGSAFGDLGAEEPQISIATTTTTPRVSPWQTIDAALRTDVIVAPVTDDGDGAADPTLTLLLLEVE